VQDLVESWNLKYCNLDEINLSFENVIKTQTFKRYRNLSFRVTKLDKEYFEKLMNDELSKDLKISGPDRLTEWEQGWGELLKALENNKSIEALEPQYFGKFPYLRFQNELYEVENFKTESLLLDFVLEILIELTLPFHVEQYLEFGCGTGHHLFKLQKLYSDKQFTGLDWSKNSQKLIMRANKVAGTNIRTLNFDYFNIDSRLELAVGSTFFTVASMEQVGDQFEQFITFILKSKPKFVIHIEPIEELFDKSIKVEELTLNYMRKRNYLRGYLNRLKDVEREGKIKIQSVLRTNFGSIFIEGYSIVVFTVEDLTNS
jgi:SAM-dependent methyltransferase